MSEPQYIVGDIVSIHAPGYDGNIGKVTRVEWDSIEKEYTYGVKVTETQDYTPYFFQDELERKERGEA